MGKTYRFTCGFYFAQSGKFLPSSGKSHETRRHARAVPNPEMACFFFSLSHPGQRSSALVTSSLTYGFSRLNPSGE